jgi:hypothetical protein
VAGSCEHDSEPSGSIRGWEFLVQLSDCHLLKKDSTPFKVTTVTALQTAHSVAAGLEFPTTRPDAVRQATLNFRAG